MTKRQLNSRNERSARRVALRDLRFAGSVAAGLVVAILGAGALAAPMLGWNQWPSVRNADETASGGSLTLTAPATRNSRTGTSPFSGSRGGVAGETATNPLTIPGLGPVAVVPTTGGVTTPVSVTAPRSSGGNGGGDRNQGGSGGDSTTVVGDGGPDNPGGIYPKPNFDQSVDSDGDGMSDEWERKYGLDPTKPDALGDDDSDGNLNGQEFIMKSSPIVSDSNDDGVTDSDDDFDGD